MIEPFLQAICGLLDPKSVRVALDLGSRDALQALELAAAFPNARVYAFECNPATLALCHANAANSDRVTVVPQAVNVSDGHCAFFPIDPARTRTSWPDGNPGASSLFVANGEYPIEEYAQGRIEVPSTRLDTFAAQRGIPRVDLIWMDLQGAELLALRSLGPLLDKVDFLDAEVSHRAIYHGQCLFPELDEYLRSRRFILRRMGEGEWQADAVYVHERRALVDVVIPCCEKDLEILPHCIRGVRRHVPDVRRIFVVSKERLTQEADWIPEAVYPFREDDIVARIPTCGNRAGWYLQQLLKLYAPFVLGDATQRILVLDADTVFLRNTEMLGPDGVPLYAVGSEHHEPYFAHIARLVPGLRRAGSVSGITHHMVIDRTVVESLMAEVEEAHQRPFWQAFLDQVDPTHASQSGASEYEVYFNYRASRFPTMGRERALPWSNVTDLGVARGTEDAFVSVHSWMRTPPNVGPKRGG